MAFHAADTHRATSTGVARKGRLKERCGLEPRTKFFFFRLRNRQKLVRIRFENIRVYVETLQILVQSDNTIWHLKKELCFMLLAAKYVAQ